jgi:leucine dehydrogenase
VAGFGTDYAMKLAENIYGTTAQIFAMSKQENIPTYAAANKTAENRIAAVAAIRTKR